MTCSGCPQPRQHLHVLLDGDGAHTLCSYCLIRLLPIMERDGTRLVLSIEPALATA